MLASCDYKNLFSSIVERMKQFRVFKWLACILAIVAAIAVPTSKQSIHVIVVNARYSLTYGATYDFSIVILYVKIFRGKFLPHTFLYLWVIIDVHPLLLNHKSTYADYQELLTDC